MKKMLLATALAPAYYRDYRWVMLLKQWPLVILKKPSPIISSFGDGRLSMQPKFVAAQKMLLKQKPSKHS